jgi:hypothetical protein
MDHDGLAWRERPRRIEHVREKRATGERVQDFGQIGAHTLALAGGKHDHIERHGAF